MNSTKAIYEWAGSIFDGKLIKFIKDIKVQLIITETPNDCLVPEIKVLAIAAAST